MSTTTSKRYRSTAAIVELLRSAPAESRAVYRFLHWLVSTGPIDPHSDYSAGAVSAVLETRAYGYAVPKQQIVALLKSLWTMWGGMTGPDDHKAAAEMLINAMRAMDNESDGNARASDKQLTFVVDGALVAHFSKLSAGMAYSRMAAKIVEFIDEGAAEPAAPLAGRPYTGNPDHFASYAIGNGLRRAMLDEQISDDIRAQAWAGYGAACDHGMTPAEAVEIRRITGLIDLSGQWEEGARDSSDEAI